MNALTTIEPVGSTALTLLDDLADAKEFGLNEKSINTRIGYQSDWKMFTNWCAQRGIDPLPASTDAVASYLAYCAKGGMAASSIGRRVSSIRYAHKLAGVASPTDDEKVRAVVRGIRRTIGTAPARKSPATADVVLQMLTLCPATLKGKRDAALLAIGFASAMRRSELCSLRVEDVEEVPDGLRITIRRSKGDQDGQGQVVAIPRGAKIRPVERLQMYLQAAGITEGPIFREVRRGGHIGEARLTNPVVANIVKHYALALGLDPSAFAGHSLRSGFLTSAAEAGASVFKMKEVSRHKSIDMLGSYVRSANMFVGHAGAAFL